MDGDYFKNRFAKILLLLEDNYVSIKQCIMPLLETGKDSKVIIVKRKKLWSKDKSVTDAMLKGQ